MYLNKCNIQILDVVKFCFLREFIQQNNEQGWLHHGKFSYNGSLGTTDLGSLQYTEHPQSLISEHGIIQ